MQQKMVAMFFMTFLVFFFPVPHSRAAEITVVNQNDAGPGSLRAAIETANSNGEPDSILFDAGVTQVVLATELPGLTENGTAIQAAHREGQVIVAHSVTLDGTGINYPTGYRLFDVSDIQISNFTLLGFQTGITGWGRLNNIEISGNTIAVSDAYTGEGSTIMLSATGGQVSGNLSILDNILQNGFFSITAESASTIDGIEIRGNTCSDGTGIDVSTGQSDGASIANLTIAQNTITHTNRSAGIELLVAGPDGPTTGNTFTNVVIDGNSVTNSYMLGARIDQGNGHQITGLQITHNSLTDGARMGIRIEGGASHLVTGLEISQNLVDRSTDEGIGLKIRGAGESSIAGIIRNNIVTHSQYGGIEIEGAVTAVVANNICGGNGSGGLGFGAGNTITAINNLLYKNVYGVTVEPPVSLRLENNLIMDSCACGIGLMFSYTIAAGYNLFWRNSADHCWTTPGGANVYVDPLLTDPDNGDFRLLPGSPAIDAGNPDAGDNDVQPPGQGGLHNDIGPFGGPYAATFAFTVPAIELPPSSINFVRIEHNLQSPELQADLGAVYILALNAFTSPCTVDQVRVISPSGETFDLHDNGPPGDMMAHDGQFQNTQYLAQHAETGVYTFQVTTFDGQLFEKTLTLAQHSLPVVVPASPADGSMVDSLTPPLTWGSVTGATGYYLYIFDSKPQDYSPKGMIYNTHITDPNAVQFQVPPGVLVLGQTYYWVIQAFQTHVQDWNNVEDMSMAMGWFTTPAPGAVIIDSPAGPTTVTDYTVTIGGIDIVAYRYKVDDGAWSSETDINVPLNFSVSGDGPHTLSVIGKGSAGNWQAEGEAATATWHVDLTGPAVSFTTPTDGAAVALIFLVEGSASDLYSEVTDVELQITDGTYFVNQQNQFVTADTWVAATGTDTWSFNTSQVNWQTGRVYTITARTRDAHDNVALSNPIEVTYGSQIQSSAISCQLSDSDIIVGEQIRVSGQITPLPGSTGAFVEIVFTPPAGEAVSRTALANSRGEFSYDLECGTIFRDGTWSVHTRWDGNQNLQASQSDPQPLTVSRAETGVTLDVTSQAIRLGEDVSISGKFTPLPDCGGGLAGIPITLTITGPSGVPDVQYLTTEDTWGHFVLRDYAGFDQLGDWTTAAGFDGNVGYQADSSPTLAVKVMETAGYAIVVQGRINNREGLASHQKTAQFVYAKLKERGLLDEDILYLAYDTNLQGVDGQPGRAAIAEAITLWARDRMDPDFIHPGPRPDVVGRPANLYIVLVDHGLEDVFYIDPEVVSAADLAGWLADLQGQLTGQAAEQEIITLLGFCRAGSFIDDLSGPQRVIIASAASGESSYKGPMDSDGVREGEYFISEFFKEVSYGKSLYQCFEKATHRTEIFTASVAGSANAPYYDASRQHPLLDDNGDQTGSNNLAVYNADGALSKDLFIGVSSVTGNDPLDVSIIAAAPTAFLKSAVNSVDLWAQVDNSNRLRTIWAEIKPPGYDPIDPGGSGQATMHLSKTVGTYNSANDRYEWIALGGFNAPGRYQAFYFAKDNITGSVSPLRETRVYKALETNRAPGEFDLVTPADGAEVLTSVLLDWEDTSDPDGHQITYTVWLSQNDDTFAVPIIIENLPYSTCLVRAEDGIEDLSTYFWKVRAIDQYGAVQETGVRVFHTNNTNPAWPCWVFGHVYDVGTGAGIAGASVNVGDSFVLPVISGGYFLGQAPAGTQTITATANGYAPETHIGVVLESGGSVTQDFGLTASSNVYPGDVSGNGIVDLADALLVLKVMAGMAANLPAHVHQTADVNADQDIGLAEFIFVLQRVSGLR